MKDIYILKADKTLSHTVRSKNYVGEENAGNIVILVPLNYDEKDVREYSFVIHFPTLKIDKVIKPCAELYKDSYIVYNYPIGRYLTRSAGVFDFYVSIEKSGFSLQSGNSSVTVVKRGE